MWHLSSVRTPSCLTIQRASNHSSAGLGWFSAVADIVMSGTPHQDKEPPRVVPVSDWRYRWAEQILRRLEMAIPMLEANKYLGSPHGYPLPPPSPYPLIPRPLPGIEESQHHFLGPPYQLLIVEGADTSNGFSYGVGGKESAGIVLYSGFFDEICPPPKEMTPDYSMWYRFPGLSRPTPKEPQPTAEQTAKLAVLLSHELAHLVLAHHVETLSAGTILFPKMMEFWMDLVRTIISTLR